MRSTNSPEKRLQAFIRKFDPKNQRVIRGARQILRTRFRKWYELVYDNYNFFVIGYSPTGRPSDSIVSITAGANGVGLCFIRGANLPDPKSMLLGSGKQTRFIRLPTAAVLQQRDVKALIVAATAKAKTPVGLGGLVIKSVSAKQRPRRSNRAAKRRQ